MRRKSFSGYAREEKPINIHATAVGHWRHVAMQVAEFAISRTLFGDILRLVA
jgi:hypothetical protein